MVSSRNCTCAGPALSKQVPRVHGARVGKHFLLLRLRVHALVRSFAPQLNFLPRKLPTKGKGRGIQTESLAPLLMRAFLSLLQFPSASTFPALPTLLSESFQPARPIFPLLAVSFSLLVYFGAVSGMHGVVLADSLQYWHIIAWALAEKPISFSPI